MHNVNINKSNKYINTLYLVELAPSFDNLNKYFKI